MSRRQRRREGNKGAGRWLVRGLIGLLILGVLVMGGGYVWLRSWLHGEDFRDMLAAETGKSLDAESEFGSFRWSGTRMDTDSFRANGEGIVRSIDAEGLRVEMGLGGFWDGVWRVDDARARRIVVELDATAADRERAAPGPVEARVPAQEKSRSWYEGLIPREVEVRALEIGSSSLSVVTRSGPVGISNTSWRLTPDEAKGSYRAEGLDGTVRLPWDWAPPMALGRARLRYQGDTVFLTDADFRVYESGRLDLSGEMSVAGEGYVFNGRLRDVLCAEILPESWKQRLAGEVESEFSVANGPAGPLVKGDLELSDGVLTALPLLDSLSAYADTTRFRRVALQEGRTDFEWRDGVLTLRDLKIGADGLMRVEGAMRIDRDDRLDGRFRLGLVPGILARIPGAETVVFAPGERGLLWTDVHLTGTIDDPKEDLTARLVEAAGLRMFEVLPETGQQVLKFTREVIGEDLQGHLEKGGDVIEQGRDVIREAEGVVREVGGIFDVLRGKERRDE